MLGAALIVSAGTVRRMLSPQALVLAALAGLLAGLAVRALPAASLAADAYAGLVRVLAAVLVLPLAASVPTADRAGGYEQLVALRPLSSLAWTAGRISGSVLGMAMLVLLLAGTTRWVAGARPMPETVDGSRMNVASDPQWRFPLPAGRRGPFDLQLSVLSRTPGSQRLAIDVTRGDGVLSLAPRIFPRAQATVPLPDLWPERGDLFVTLHPGPGLVLDDAPPRLVVGTVPLGRDALALPMSACAGLFLALLAALAAACAFHFETACLAGLLALAVELPEGRWPLPAAVALLALIATLGTALQRRSAMP
ncbi:MAG TPA: hypothetical protein VK824_12415 [Planctomycetota bacterium]|nr:hypothetical protein [Planctomycetota bacterium]